MRQEFSHLDRRWRYSVVNPRAGPIDLFDYRLLRWQDNSDAGGFTGHQYFLGLHLGLIALSAAVLPALWLRSTLRRRRIYRLGLCPNCGYDLRASPDRCPECGTTPHKPQSAKPAAPAGGAAR